MSTTAPPILDGSGTIAKIFTFTADGSVDLEITLGAKTSGASSISVDVKNLTTDTVLDTINFTGLTAATTSLTTTVTVSGLTGEEIGLVATQTGGTKTWVDSAIPVPVSGVQHAVAGTRNIWMSDGSTLHVYESESWTQLVNGAGLNEVSALGIDVTSDSALVVDHVGNKIWRVTRDDVWTDVTNGEDVSTVVKITGYNDTEITIAKTNGDIRAYNGSSWSSRNDVSVPPVFIQYDVTGDIRLLRGESPYKYKKWDGSAWDGTTQLFTIEAMHYGFSGALASDDFNVIGITSSGTGKTLVQNSPRYGSNSFQQISNNPDPTAINYQGGFFLGDKEHIVHDEKIVTVSIPYEISFENLSVTELVPTDGPHVYNAVRETILRPDAGPHVYNAVRETIFGEIKEPEGVYIKAQFTDVVMAPLPGPNIKAQFTDIVMAPLPGPNIKAQFTDVVMQKLAGPTVYSQYTDTILTPLSGPNVYSQYTDTILTPLTGPNVYSQYTDVILEKDALATIQKQTVSVVIKPPPPEMKVQKQTVSVVIKEKKPAKLHWQQAAVLIQPSYGKVKLHKQQIAAVIQPPPAETFLHWQQAAAVAQPDKTYVRLYQQQIAVVVMPNPRPKRRMGSMQLVTIKGTR